MCLTNSTSVTGAASVTVTVTCVTRPHSTANLREWPRAEPSVCGQVPVNAAAAANHATTDRGESDLGPKQLGRRYACHVGQCHNKVHSVVQPSEMMNGQRQLRHSTS
jgi:hypothetical protein